MAAAKHTPGPWTVVDDKTRMYTDSARIEGPDGDTVFDVGPDDTMEIDDGAIAEVLSPTRKANVRLAAGAPDLLDALRLFAEEGADLTDSLCHRGLTTPEQCARCKKVLSARAAIAAAEGK